MMIRQDRQDFLRLSTVPVTVLASCTGLPTAFGLFGYFSRTEVIRRGLEKIWAAP